MTEFTERPTHIPSVVNDEVHIEWSNRVKGTLSDLYLALGGETDVFGSGIDGVHTVGELVGLDEARPEYFIGSMLRIGYEVPRWANEIRDKDPKKAQRIDEAMEALVNAVCPNIGDPDWAKECPHIRIAKNRAHHYGCMPKGRG
jgi:hypothetical protein